MTGNSPPLPTTDGGLGVPNASFEKSYMYVTCVCDPFNVDSQLILVQMRSAVPAHGRAVQYSTDPPLARHYLGPSSNGDADGEVKDEEEAHTRVLSHAEDEKPDSTFDQPLHRPPSHLGTLRPQVRIKGDRAPAGKQQTFKELISRQTSRRVETDRYA